MVQGGPNRPVNSRRAAKKQSPSEPHAAKIMKPREAEKRILLDGIKESRIWFDRHSEDEQARILKRFKAALDKLFLLADFKRAKFNGASVDARFVDFVNLE